MSRSEDAQGRDDSPRRTFGDAGRDEKRALTLQLFEQRQRLEAANSVLLQNRLDLRLTQRLELLGSRHFVEEIPKPRLFVPSRAPFGRARSTPIARSSAGSSNFDGKERVLTRHARGGANVATDRGTRFASLSQDRIEGGSIDIEQRAVTARRTVKEAGE